MRSMAAERLEDPRYEVSLPYDKEAIGEGTFTVILDAEGNWCKIPCVSTAQNLRDAIVNYVNPRVDHEIQRLKIIQSFIVPDSEETDVVLGLGLFYYEAPESGLLEPQEWKMKLSDALKQAGLQIKDTPSYLLESVHPSREYFFGSPINPYEYFPLNSLHTMTFVLGPTLCRFTPELTSGTNIALGYQACIGVDGNALIGLLEEGDILTFPDNPELNRVRCQTIMNRLQPLLKRTP